MDKFPLTKDGFVALEAELKHLKGVDRPNIIAAIAEARSHGDLSENAEYSAAKEKQSFIEGRIQELEAVISRAQVIDPSQNTGNVIRFGATVVVVDEDTDAEKSYQIVGDYEANIEKNKISLVLRRWPKRSSAKKSATLPNTSRPAAENLSKFSRSFTNRLPLKFVCQ